MNGRTLLYVEDNPANIELVQQLVERHPALSLLTAADGVLGIKLATASCAKRWRKRLRPQRAGPR